MCNTPTNIHKKEGYINDPYSHITFFNISSSTENYKFKPQLDSTAAHPIAWLFTDSITFWQDYVEIGTLIFFWWEWKSPLPFGKTLWWFLLKVNYCQPCILGIQPNNYNPRILSSHNSFSYIDKINKKRDKYSIFLKWKATCRNIKESR